MSRRTSGTSTKNGKPIDDVVVLTPAKRHLYDQFVKYDDVNGNLYILEDLEVDKSYELRASYSAKTPGKVSIVLLEGGEGKGEEEESESRRQFQRSSSRKLLDVEKIAFKVSNYDESSNSNEGTTRLFFSSSSSSKKKSVRESPWTPQTSSLRTDTDSSHKKGLRLT